MDFASWIKLSFIISVVVLPVFSLNTLLGWFASTRKPNRKALGAVQLNDLRGVNHGAIVVKDAQTGQTIAKKVEGKEMLSKVKKYKPVVIKGYKYAF